MVCLGMGGCGTGEGINEPHDSKLIPTPSETHVQTQKCYLMSVRVLKMGQK